MVKKAKEKLGLAALTLVSERFKALSEPLRLQILQELQNGELNVSALTELVSSTQPNVSKHLKILQDHGLVKRRQEGNTVYYSIADENVFELCAVVCDSLRSRFNSQADMFANSRISIRNKTRQTK